MKAIQHFQQNRLPLETLSAITGGIRYFTTDQVERRRIRRQLRKMRITYSDAVIKCPITGERTYCIEW